MKAATFRKGRCQWGILYTQSMVRAALLAALLPALLASEPVPPSVGDGDHLRRTARAYLKDWNARRFDAVFERFTPEFQAHVPRARVDELFGVAVPFEVISDSAAVLPGKGGRYWVELRTPTGNAALEIWFTPSGKVAGQGPASADQGPSPYRSPNAGRLLADPFFFPFAPATGKWRLGGTHHRPNRAQRYAMDFVIVRDEATYRGDAARNASYFAYGEEIRTPSDGVVIDAHDGEPDNIPGKTFDGYLGNYVVIRIAEDAFALFAHLKPGSKRVTKGDRVRAKDVIGEVGNSGHSTEPHLHLHVTDAYPANGGWERSDGIPMHFSRVIHSGASRARATASDGDSMSAVE